MSADRLPFAHVRARLMANAIFEYLQVFHNRQRRHSALGMLNLHRD